MWIQTQNYSTLLLRVLKWIKCSSPVLSGEEIVEMRSLLGGQLLNESLTRAVWELRTTVHSLQMTERDWLPSPGRPVSVWASECVRVLGGGVERRKAESQDLRSLRKRGREQCDLSSSARPWAPSYGPMVMLLQPSEPWRYTMNTFSSLSVDDRGLVPARWIWFWTQCK